MDWYVIVLRALHIVGGVFWVGTSFFFFFFVEPTTKAIGPQAGPFMEHLTRVMKFPVIMAIAAATTIVAGALLYWEASGGLDTDWITSGPGLTFTVGALAAIIAFGLGIGLIKPAVTRMAAIGAEVGAAGGTPTPEQGAELHALEARLSMVGRVDFVLFTVAVVTMAVARYV